MISVIKRGRAAEPSVSEPPAHSSFLSEPEEDSEIPVGESAGLCHCCFSGFAALYLSAVSIY